jgi:capsular exopolysaccharide synthesis family protein
MNGLTHYSGSAPSEPVAAPHAAAREHGYYYARQNDETHLRDYWKILLKRARPMALVFSAVMVLGLMMTCSSPTLYTAKSVLKIEPQNPAMTGVPEMVPHAEAGPYDYYQTQFSMLKSDPLVARVVDKLGLEAKFRANDKSFLRALIDITLTPIDWIETGFARLFGSGSSSGGSQEPVYEFGVPPWIIGQYLSYLRVEPVRNTRLVEIVFSTPDPKMSQEMANAHATSFIQMTLENRFNLSSEARDFLGKRLSELREKVQAAESKLNTFRQQYGVVSLEKGENIVVERLVDLNKELTRAKGERIQAESLYSMTRNRNTEYLAQVLNNGLIQQLKASLATLETEKGRLSSIFMPDHPRIQELNQQIAEARKALGREVGNIVQGIESSYASAKAREEALEAEAGKQQSAALNLKELGVEYAVLNEDVLVNRGLYESVLKRLNETNVANDLAASNMQVVQRADLPLAPSSPNTMRNLFIAALAGLVLAVALALFLEYMDSRMSTPEGVWAAVSLATLGVVPHLKSLQKRYEFSSLPRTGDGRLLEAPKRSSELLPKELVMARDQLSIVAESYRTIRTALLASRAESPPRSIVLTSPCPDEGKTITTLNLAMSLAQSGKRVIVVDADLRKGRCHKLINVAHNIGLVDVLSGQRHLHACVQSTVVRNLYLLARGTLPPNPGDLLTSQRMREVVRELSSSFDFVIIDSPPVIAVSDAAVLSTLCDGVLLVFHSQKTTTLAARRAVEHLESIEAPILGVVLNGVDLRDPEYADYRSYFPAYFSSARDEFGHADENEAAIAKTTVMPRTEAYGPGAAKNSFVPRQFIDGMIARLNDALGGESGGIVRNQVAALRESMDAFPMARIWELVQLVSQEIWEHQRKVKFLRAMSADIRDLRAI